MKMTNQDIVRTALFCVAILALICGVIVYIFVRDTPSLYLLTLLEFGQTDSLQSADETPSALLLFTGSLPTAVHTFAFTVFTALALGVSRRSHVVFACFFWAAINTAFEFSQVADVCPDLLLLNQSLLGRVSCNYISAGTFDWLDIGSVILGSFAAYLSLIPICKKTGVP